MSAFTFTCQSGTSSYATTIPACITISDIYATQCATLQNSARDACVCQPDTYNAIIECENGIRECLQAIGDGYATILSNWHEQCDPYTTITEPTSTLVTPTFTFADANYCLSIQNTDCYTISSYGKQCLDVYTDLTQSQGLSSCICQPDLYSAASVCEYDGNKTCLGRPAAISNIDLWAYCQVTALPTETALTNTGVSSAVPGSTPTDTSPVTTSMRGSGSMTVTAAPTNRVPTSSSGAVTTSDGIRSDLSAVSWYFLQLLLLTLLYHAL